MITNENSVQNSLNKKYLQSQRELITELDLSGWDEESWTAKDDWEKLTGELDLSEFTNLETLNCSFNKITSLNLENCSELTELKCWGNDLTEIKFPAHLKLKTFQAWTNNLTKIDWSSFDSESLTYISISNNNLSNESIEVITRFTNLEELYIGNDDIKQLVEKKYNTFTGTLKTLLENCPKLIRLQIEETGIENDLKIVPKDLKIISWYKQNASIAMTFPLERLSVIGFIIRQFLMKWGTKSEKNVIELSNLRSSEDLLKWKTSVYLTKFIAQVSTVAGTALTLQEGGIATGIGILAIAPFSELLSWRLEEKMKNKEEKWKEFLIDSNKFLKNYNELVGIINQFTVNISLRGPVIEGIKNLRENVHQLLETHDDNKDGEIDINELTVEKREILIKDISKGEDGNIQGISDNIKKLEQSIIDYRRFSYYRSTSYNKNYEYDNRKIKTTSQLAIENSLSDNQEIVEHLSININD